MKMKEAISKASQNTDISPVYSWIVKKQRLNFIISGLQIFRASFSALVLDHHQSFLPNDLSAIKLPLDKLQRNLGVMVIPSFGSEIPIPRISLRHNCICYISENHDNHWIEMGASFEEYLMRLSKKSRHELLRKVRKFEEKFGKNTSVKVYKKPEEMSSFLDLASRISRKTYQEILLNDGLPSTDEFSQELVSLAAEDRVRGYLMMVDNAPVSYGYCVRQDSVLMYNITGYNPDYKEWSPGIVLFYSILDKVFAEERFRLLDLGSMKGQWKSSYVTCHNPGSRIIYIRCFSRYVPLVLAHWIVSSVSDFIVRLITVLGLNKKLRGLLHSREISTRRRAQGG
jgi:hypothetical protein